jgi:vacuolar-type H+-ATPase subunit E/Vma4
MQTINNDAIEKADQAIFNQLWKITSEANTEEKKAIAALAILHSDEGLRAERFGLYNITNRKPAIAANNLLHKISNGADKVSFAIAILENLSTTGEQ